MFNNGEQVVCIDGKFEPWVYDLYAQLPKEGSVYTVRAMRAARSNPKFNVNDDAEIKLTDAEFDVMVLLSELINPDDPYSTVKQELGFRAERFQKMEEVAEEVAEEISVGDLVPA